MTESKAIGFFYIALTVLLTVYGQLMIKWRLAHFGSFPAEWSARVSYFRDVLIDPFILSSFAAAFLASLTWMAAVSKFEISYAYPFMSAAFVLVLLLSVVFLGEALTWQKIVGLCLIVLGIVVASKGG